MKAYSVKRVLLAVSLLSGILTALPLQAGPLNINLEPHPHIIVGDILVDYNAAGDMFTTNVDNAVFEINYTTVSGVFFMADFSLTAKIDDTGAFSGGTLEITDFPDTILTGTITDFSYNPATDLLEFLFDTTANNLFEPFGPKGGILLSGTGFSGDFTQNSFYMGPGAAHIAPVNIAPVNPVPEPATCALLLLGLPALYMTRRFRKKS